MFNRVSKDLDKSRKFLPLLFLIIFAILGLVIWVGARLIENGQLEVKDMYKCLFSLIFGAVGMATASLALPDLGSATVSLDRIFKILEAKFDIDARNDQGIGGKNSGSSIAPEFKGRIEFTDVVFSYPSRPNEIVLNGLTLSIEPGQKVGFAA